MMLPSKALVDLQFISQAIGSDSAWVQGGGGNTSIKSDNELMAIKASGCTLAEVSVTSGYCWVNYRKIAEGLNSSLSDDDAYEALLRSSVHENSGRKPSMESGFHALLGSVVIHSHSVYVNLLTCSKEGESLTKKIFPDALWLDYKTPGRKLCLKLAEALRQLPAQPTHVFLQNHGLIISAGTAKEALALHDQTHELIASAIPDIPPFDLSRELANHEMGSEMIFPDQVVYCRDQVTANSRAGKETAAAAAYVSRAMKTLNFTPRYLSDGEISEIEQMQSEVYRRAKASE